MSNEFTIQSEAQVTNIKNRQATKDIVTDIVSNIQNDLVNTDEINNKLDTIINATAQVGAVATDLSNTQSVTNQTNISNPQIDTLGEQNKDILIKLANQNTRINELENKLDLILEKLS
jgi:hypothetical protein